MPRLWIKVIRNHRIERHEAFDTTMENIKDTLTEALHDFDISRPVWLNKHEREFDSFRRTTFTKDHFMEPVDFDQLEIEYLDDSGKKRKSNDPRNQF